MSSVAAPKKLLAFGLAALAALALSPAAFADNITTDSDQSDVTAVVGAEIAITATDPGQMTLSHLNQPATSIGHVEVVSTQPDWTVSIKDTDATTPGNLDRTAGTGPSALDQAFEYAPGLLNSAAVTGSNQEVFTSSANDGLDVGFSQELTAGEDVLTGDTYATTVEYSVAVNLPPPTSQSVCESLGGSYGTGLPDSVDAETWGSYDSWTCTDFNIQLTSELQALCPANTNYAWVGGLPQFGCFGIQP